MEHIAGRPAFLYNCGGLFIVYDRTDLRAAVIVKSESIRLKFKVTRQVGVSCYEQVYYFDKAQDVCLVFGQFFSISSDRLYGHHGAE